VSPVPSVEGILTADQVRATAASIAAVQDPHGFLSVGDEHADMWNHVEAAMACLVGGEVEAAEAAYRFMPALQRADGSWPKEIRNGVVVDDRGEVNMSAYLAVGLWHHWLVRRDLDFVRSLWPHVRAALDFVIGLQQPFGGIQWTPVDDLCLLTGNSSIHHSLRAGVALAELVDEPQPEWELAGGRLAHAIREHRDLFADKATFSMDWYYPVLGGAVRGDDASALLASRWDDFVVPGLGARCVDTNPWVTGAETCELAMALDALGDHRRALALLADMQHLREPDGRYWTGWVYDDGTPHEGEPRDVHWPVEHTTYTAAAVILAVDALGEVAGHSTAGSGIMRGTSLGAHFGELALECACVVAPGVNRPVS
jgi:hypothetical protein